MLCPLGRVLVGSWLLLGCSSEAARGGGGGARAGGGGATSGASGGGAVVAGGNAGRGGDNARGGTGVSGSGTAGGAFAAGMGGARASSAGGMGNVGGDAVAEAGASDTGGASGAGTERTCLSSNIDLSSTTVSGKITVNGVPISDMNEGIGSLAFGNRAGDYAALGSVPGSSYSALVAPGTYDLEFSGQSGSNLPFGGVILRHDVAVGTSPLSLDVDVATTAVSTTVTLNGGLPPDDGSSGDGDAFLELRRGAGEQSEIAYMISPAQASLAFPGTYDVYYSVFSRAPGGVPTNTSAKVQSGVVIDGSHTSLKIDIPATTVSVSATVAGAPISGAISQLTFLTLKNDAGDTAALTVTNSAGDSSALVIPGTYDLYYGVYGESCIPPATCGAGDTFAPNVPMNASVKVKSGIVVGTSPVSLAVDLPATRVSGVVTLNGSAADGLDGAGLLTLKSEAGDFVELSPDATGAYSELVLPGTYDLVYRINADPRSGLGALPVNLATKFRSSIVVGTSPLTLDIDIPVTTVTGSITLNGATLPPAGKGDGDGWVSLSNADGAWAELGSLRGGAFSALVIPGTYDLAYSGKRDDLGVLGTGVPINLSSTFERGVVVGTSPLDFHIDVPAVAVSGAVTVNGVAVTNVNRLTLMDPSGVGTPFASVYFNSDSSALATGAYSELVIPGSYELYFQDYSSGTPVPDNEHLDLGCFEVH